MIIVVGDSFLDEYWYGDSTRLSPEAPVPVINKSEAVYAAGGAANVALNLHALGSDVVLITTIGKDDNGKVLQSLVKDIYSSLSREAKTLHKLRIYANDQCVCRIDDEMHYQPTEPLESCDGDLVILSDYGKGTVDNASKWLNRGFHVAVDPKRSFEHYNGAWLIKPNLAEFKKFVSDVDSIEDIIKRGRAALYQFNISSMLVTMGSRGMVYISKHSDCYVPTSDVPVHDVTGAGDVVMAAFCHSMYKGDSVLSSIKFAQKCASVAIQKRGTYVLKKSDISSDKRMVFTNGCFDIIHPGHIEILKQAKSLGDYLIVGLNSDNSVKRLKGESRPINSEHARAEALKAIRYVDEVIIFDEDTPLKLIEKIAPDVIVKGGDYKKEDVVGNHLAEVVIVPYVGGYSTTKLINDIKKDAQ